MLGTLLAYSTIVLLNLPLLLFVFIALALGALLGILEEWIAIRPLQGLGIHGELVTTLGVSVVLEGAAVLIWGNQPLAVPFFHLNKALTLLSGRVLPVELALIGIAFGVAVGAEMVLRRTFFGLTSLANAEDQILAMLRGIDVRSLSLYSFALAGAICTALGVFVAPKTFASFDLGNTLAIKGFVALAIGGFGSQKGAFIGGIVTGLVEAAALRYLSINLQNATVFALLLLILLIRPQGVFGEHVQRTI
jgi:branched-chain amino acid transport system permease protein